MSKPSRPYRSLTKAEKEAEIYGRIREPAMSCPACEVQVMPSDMPRHLERCQGRREPHPMSRWIGRSEAMRLGVSRQLLRYWTRAPPAAKGA